MRRALLTTAPRHGAHAQLACALAIASFPVAVHAARGPVVTEGTHFAVSVAPDGRAAIDLQGQLWIIPAGGGAATAISDGSGDDRLPRFAPDGGSIAFQTFREGSWDIALARPDGTGARLLTRGAADDREPAWSADGTRVVFASDRAGSYDLWSVDVASGALERLTSDPGDEYAPAIATDGRLAYVSDRDGRPALWLGDDAGEPRRIAEVSGSRLAAPAFSPDDRRLAFIAPAEEMNFPAMARHRLGLLDLATGATRWLSAEGADVFPFTPAWRDASTVLYSADGGLRSIDVESGMASSIPFSARFAAPRRAPRPRWRVRDDGPRAARGIVEPVAVPGRGIVFVALGDLWLRADDGSLARLTNDSFVDRDPAVSADGRLLAFVSDRAGDMQVWILDLGSGGQRQLTAVAGGVRYPTFAPDGLSLAFQQPGPRGDQDFFLQIIGIDGGPPRRIRAPPLWPGRMSFTADGRHLLVSALTPASKRFREGSNRLLVVDVADGSTRDAGLPADVAPDFGPALSPDGTRIALIVDGALAVAPLSPDGAVTGPAREIRAELVDYPSWSADSAAIFCLGPRGLMRVDPADGRATDLPTRLDWTPAGAPAPVIVHARRLFDGLGDAYRENVDVLVEGRRIVAVRDHREHPPGVDVIDAGERVVLPGLVENHAHHQGHDGGWVGRAWLAFGVTSVVEPGGLPYESLELAEAWDSGARPGPRLFYAGPQLDGLRRYFPFASHATSARRLGWELERAERLDYALLKTYTRMTPGRQLEVIRRARALGRLSSSHEIHPALAEGAGRVEHLRGTSRAGFSSKQSDRLRSYGDVIALVAAPRAVISPTLVVSGGFFSHWLAHPELADNRQFRALWPAAYRDGLAAFAGVVGRRRTLLDEGAANARRAVHDLYRSGARVVAGTDSPIFPYGLALVVELAGYVEAGLTPAEALRTATGDSAAALGLDADLGTIRRGRLADLVFVAGDPLRNVDDLLAVDAVMRAGRYFRLEDLLQPAP